MHTQQLQIDKPMWNKVSSKLPEKPGFYFVLRSYRWGSKRYHFKQPEVLFFDDKKKEFHQYWSDAERGDKVEYWTEMMELPKGWNKKFEP